MDPIEFRRGDVVLVDLTEHTGAEMEGVRPCVVVQRDELNRVLPTTIVVPLTDARAWRNIPAQVYVSAEHLGKAGKDSVVSIVGIRQIDKSRIRSKPLSELPRSTMADVDGAIQHVLRLDAHESQSDREAA